MKFILPLLLSLGIFAQVPELTGWEKLTALGFLGAVCLLLVVKVVPSRDAAFAKQAQASLAAIDSLAGRVEKVTENFRAATETLATKFAETAQVMLRAVETQHAQEGQRQHEDNVRLVETLTTLREHCAAKLKE